MLRSKYAGLIEQKKNAYRQYRQARDDIRNLIRNKANAEMILEIDTSQERGRRREQSKPDQAR